MFRWWSRRHAGPRRCLIHSMLSSVAWASRWRNPATQARRVQRETYDSRHLAGRHEHEHKLAHLSHLQRRTRHMKLVPVLSPLPGVSLQQFLKSQQSVRSQGLDSRLSSVLLSILSANLHLCSLHLITTLVAVLCRRRSFCPPSWFSTIRSCHNSISFRMLMTATYFNS